MDTLAYSVWADLLGKPWRKDARGPDAYDCAGLLLEIQRRLGRAVPNWTSDQSGLDAAAAQWERISDPRPGDAILFTSVDPPWHVSVVCGGGYMIHAREGAGVVRERYNSFPWHARIEGFYRWKQALSPF
jgi:cell wall-associated NlpC family hydrolase